jgi:hypothetical protein
MPLGSLHGPDPAYCGKDTRPGTASELNGVVRTLADDPGTIQHIPLNPARLLLRGLDAMRSRRSERVALVHAVELERR